MIIYYKIMLVYTIEDLVEKIYNSEQARTILSLRDKSVMFGVAAQFKKSLPLTLNQANLILSIMEQNKEKIDIIFENQNLLKTPVFKFPFRIVDGTKKIFLKDNTHIGIRFPYNVTIKNFLSKEMSGKINYDKESKTFYYQATTDNIIKLAESDEIRNAHFELSSDFENLYVNIQKIIKNSENYLPTIDYNDEIFLKNTSKLASTYFDLNKTTDLLSNIFLAKKLEINLSKKLIDHINSMNIDPNLLKLLLKEENVIQASSETEKDINFIISFIKTVKQWPVLVIFGNNDNDEKELYNWYSALLSQGIENVEMSVLFRSQSNKDCNIFIRDNKINNLVTDQTKVVFIKNKIPKILYKINFEPKIVISTSKFYAHFTSQKLIDSHPFIILYTDQTTTGIQIGKL